MVKYGHSGFTLIEILVVMLIMSVMAGMIVISFPSFTQNADLEKEARRLQLLFGMARTEAVLDSMEFGFKASKGGYQFLQYDDATQKWQKMSKPFHERELVDDFRLTLKIEESEFSLPGKNVPPVLILSSGEMTPFKLELEFKPGRETRTLRSTGFGELTLESEDD